MTRPIHPLLVLIARATEKERVLSLECLKAENRILRSKLPRRIEVTPAERDRLVRLGVGLGSALRELITFVHPCTFARWISEAKFGVKPRKRTSPQA